MQKYFIITIDTEGDNLFRSPNDITTKNAEFLERFQILCEKYYFRPTWLTNYEMAIDPVFKRFGQNIIKKATGEIGLHIHAWNNPPINYCTQDDFKFQPYLTEYSKTEIRNKIVYQISLLEDTFQVKILSHRAGRWTLNEYYAQVLCEYGIKVDCSVTPHISWEKTLGNPNGKGGSDYSNFNENAYFLDLKALNNEDNATKSLLEVPVTIRQRKYTNIINSLKNNNNRHISRLTEHYYPANIWMRPNGRNKNDLLWLINKIMIEDTDYIEFMIHSSELMPGGSPTFTTKRSIERLYSDLDSIFMKIKNCGFKGETLSQYYHDKINNIG